MKSEKALKVIEKTLFRNGFPSKRLLGQNGNDVMTVYDAITAIELAEQEAEERMRHLNGRHQDQLQELRDKAVEAHRKCCLFRNYRNNECANTATQCGEHSCFYMNDFIQKLNEK